MITKNFKTILALILESNNYSSDSVLAVKNTAGAIRYIGCYFNNYNFPVAINHAMQINSTQTAQGVYVGTGSTAPTADDYKLEAVIASGITASDPSRYVNVDSDGNPYIQLIYTLTNTTSSDITINEIGYIQTMRTSNTAGTSATAASYLMLDRTVLSTPVTVPANGTAAIKYTLKTVIS